MDNSKTKIGNIEIILIIIGIKLGERFISLPSTSSYSVSYASIASVFIGGLIALVISYLFARLALSFPDRTIIEFSQDILGKIIGKIAVLIFFIYFLIFCSMYIRRIGEFSKQEFLFNTPIEFIMMIFIFISAYCSAGGIPIIGKVSDFLVGSGVATTIFLLVISIPFINYQELLPAFQIESLKKVNLLSPGLASYCGIEIILFILPFMKTPKDIKKSTIKALLAIVAIYTLDVLISMGVLTEPILEHRLFPIFAVGKTIAFPSLFDIRFDIIYASLWIFLIYMVMVGYEYLTSVTFAGLFDLKSHSVFVILFAPFFYMIGLFPQSLGQTYEVLGIMDQIWVYVIIGSIFFIYLVGIIRKKVKI